ncbi:polysaccharide pyruvyl transferase family protein [Bacteroides heparinolyticus]|uniref:polysaccharide pyruvyl transferase family protein n=1 Tax=Prevotella heparinolytica TaxID=28113 RepID=UPI0023F50267|nr:polysaccharide pyruvyl transferase family protein [Bacteroides heparinolyticus]
MKKIGILTYHRAINYGAFLQCYSLVEKIKQECPGCLVEVIDFETRGEFIIKIKSLIKSGGIVDFIKKLKMFTAFHRNVNKYLPLSKKHIVSNRADCVKRNYSADYDIIIVGSDAVWNNVNEPAKLNFYLHGIDCVKMSYAASCSGLNTNVIGKKDKLFLKEALSSFTYIGVREEKVEHFLTKIAPTLKYSHNCDPTCFIDLTTIDTNKLEKKLFKYGINANKRIICIMTKNEFISKRIYSEYHETHQIVGLYTYNKYVDVMLYDLEPIEFAVFFKYVDILFTYFFHGAYLALKNGIPVIALEENIEPDNEVPKIKYLFERLGLHDWYFRPNEMGEEEISHMMRLSKYLMEVSQKERLKECLFLEEQFSGSFLSSLKSLIPLNE